jgi:hypothetical protein
MNCKELDMTRTLHGCARAFPASTPPERITKDAMQLRCTLASATKPAARTSIIITASALVAMLLTSSPRAQFLHRVDNAVPAAPSASGMVVTDFASNRVLWIDGATGSTFQLNYTGTNSWTPLGIPPVTIGGATLATCRGTGPTARVFVMDTFTQAAFELQGNTWAPVTMSGTPSARTQSHLVGLANGDVLLFGGSAGGVILADTWLLQGGTWNPGPVGPPARAAGGATRDATGALIVGGSNSGGFLSDTWRFAGGAWSQVVASGSPQQDFPGVAHHLRTNETVLISGINGGPLLSAFFLRNGVWFPITQGSFSLPLVGLMTAAVDPVHDEIVAVDLVGGTTVLSSYSGMLNVGTQPASCICTGATGQLLLASSGTPRIGGTFNVNFTNALPGLVFLAFSTTLANPPTAIPGFPGCLQFIGQVAGTTSSFGPPFPPVSVTVPNTVDFVGFQITYEAFQLTASLATSCASDALDVRIGR